MQFLQVILFGGYNISALKWIALINWIDGNKVIRVRACKHRTQTAARRTSRLRMLSDLRSGSRTAHRPKPTSSVARARAVLQHAAKFVDLAGSRPRSAVADVRRSLAPRSSPSSSEAPSWYVRRVQFLLSFEAFGGYSIAFARGGCAASSLA